MARKNQDTSAPSKQKVEGGAKSVLCSLAVHFILDA
jgi:hypothetical protein